MKSKKYKCPECGLSGVPLGDGYCPCRELDRVILVEIEPVIEPTPPRMHIIDGQFFACDGC